MAETDCSSNTACAAPVRGPPSILARLLLRTAQMPKMSLRTLTYFARKPFLFCSNLLPRLSCGVPRAWLLQIVRKYLLTTHMAGEESPPMELSWNSRRRVPLQNLRHLKRSRSAGDELAKRLTMALETSSAALRRKFLSFGELEVWSLQDIAAITRHPQWS